MTCYEFLSNLSNYPISGSTLRSVCAERGVDPNATLTDVDIAKDKALNLARADVYARLAVAPNISENGVSFSFTAEQKEHFTLMANRLYKRFGEPESIIGDLTGSFGYKGSRL